MIFITFLSLTKFYYISYHQIAAEFLKCINTISCYLRVSILIFVELLLCRLS